MKYFLHSILSSLSKLFSGHRNLVFLFLLGIWLFPLRIYAQDEIETDSSGAEIEPTTTLFKPVWRSVETDSVLNKAALHAFQKENLEKYLSDKDYLYDHNQPPERQSWWSRFLNWFFSKLGAVFVPKGSGNTWRTILWVLAGVLVIFAIIKIVGADPRSLFARKPKSTDLSYTEDETDIHVIDFDALIAEAVSKQQYKRAVRLFYLKSLKQLSDREWIMWQPHKTNYEYVRELKNHAVATDFRQATHLFELIWYGDFQLTPASFSDTEKQFKELEKRINTM